MLSVKQKTPFYLFTNTVLLTTVILLMNVTGSFASHLIGAEITYLHISGNTYEITLVVYDDCDAGFNILNQGIRISSASCNINATPSLPRVETMEITNTCDATTCNNGARVGWVKHVYKDLYTFPTQCNDWVISYVRDGRTGVVSIDNIFTPTNDRALYVESILNNLDFTSNNSPQFTTDPVTYVCNGVPITYQHTVVENDGDVLTYSLVQPMKAAGATLAYQPGYSVTYPITTTLGTLPFNTSTGAMNFTSNAVQNCAVPVKIEEHRNGILVGSVVREILINIVNNCAGINSIPFTYNNHDIITPTTWTTGTFPGDHVYVNGTLSIKSGASLMVDAGVIVEFGPDGKVIVEESGQLTLDNATLQGLALCNNMWQGVRVWGQCNDKGKITMSNNAVIRDAHVGVLIGKTCATCTLAPYDDLAGFGSIDARDSKFINNAIGVTFAHSWCSCSIIKDCEFSGGTLLDPRYNSTNTAVADQYPDAAHPYYAASNPIGRSSHGIFAMKGNYFSTFNNAFTNMEVGIESFDSHFSLYNHDGTGHSFSTVREGINLNYTPGQGGLPMYVNNNAFDLFQRGVYIENSLFDKVRENTFQNVLQGTSEGLVLNNAEGYQVYDNDFDRVYTGAICINSKNRGGIIGPIVDGNIFTNTSTGVATMQDNTNLQIRCNDFTPDPNLYPYYKNWFVQDQLADQGIYDIADPNNDENPAGNRFNELNNKEISSLSNPFTYFHHSSPVEMIPDPDGILTSANLFNNGIAATGSSCAPPPAHQGLPNQIADAKTALSGLTDELQQVKQSVDGGNTPAVLAGIQSLASEPEVLLAFLQAASPISDEALLDVIDISATFSSEIYRGILLPNLPASKQVWQTINPTLAEMSPLDESLLRQAQIMNPAYRTPTAIEREINYLTMNRQLWINRMLNFELNAGNTAAMIDWLESEETPIANLTLVSLYIAEAERTQADEQSCPAGIPVQYLNLAMAKLDKLEFTTPEDRAWAELLAMNIGLKLEGKSWFGMSSEQEAQIRETKDAHPNTIAGSAAITILRMVFREKYPLYTWEPPQEKTGSYKEKQMLDKEIEHAGCISAISPNPARNTASVTYEVPEGATAILMLYTTTGRLIKSIPIAVGKGTATIDTGDMGKGVYICSMEINGITKDYRRLIVLR